MKELTITSAALQETSESGERKRRGNRTTRVPAILEASIRVFATEGNAGFTQRRVASDAGIRLSTLQHYFGTRDELLRSTIEEMGKRYVQRYRALARDKLRSPEARLDVIVDETFAALTGPGTSLSAFALHCWSLAEHEAFVNELAININGEFLELLAGLVAKINPALPSAECMLRSALILSNMEGLTVFVRRAGENAPDLDALRAATKVVWKALSNAPQ
jgi:AcrR family transcriptional regulator